MSVWQYVHLSEELRPRDTLVCWWDVKHPKNKQTGRVIPVVSKQVRQCLPTLPGAWRYRVSAGTGWLGVSILYTVTTYTLPGVIGSVLALAGSVSVYCIP